MRELKTTKEIILDRALYLVGQKGSIDISVRDIANEAKVNVAAINYHFKTKDNMLQALDEFFINNAIDAYKVLKDNSLGLEERLLLWMEDLTYYILRYPGVTILIKEKLKYPDANEYSRRIVDNLKENDRLVDDVLKQWIEISDEQTYKFMKLSLISSINFPFSTSHVLNDDIESLDTPTKRKAYFKYVLDTLKKT